MQGVFTYTVANTIVTIGPASNPSLTWTPRQIKTFLEPHMQQFARLVGQSFGDWAVDDKHEQVRALSLAGIKIEFWCVCVCV